MDLGLKGKRALVTGSSAGLGFAVAKEYVREGAQVVICGRTAETLAAAEKELSATGTVHAVQADVSSPEGIDHVLTMADAHMGGVDILCMSTGGPKHGTFETLAPEDYTEAATNLIESLVRLIKGVLPGMIDREWGRVMAVTSVSQKQPLPNLMLSNVARPGIGGLLKSLSNEHAKDGVTFNCLMPGLSETSRLTNVIADLADKTGRSYDEVAAEYGASIPAGRIAQPEEFAALAAFLASTRASYITGTAIPVDGGRTQGL